MSSPSDSLLASSLVEPPCSTNEVTSAPDNHENEDEESENSESSESSDESSSEEEKEEEVVKVREEPELKKMSKRPVFRNITSTKRDSSDAQFHFHVSTGNIEVVVEMLRTEPHLIGATTNDGRTALHIASTQGNEKLVEILLEHKADINSAMDDGVTALMLACGKAHIGVVRILLKRGANFLLVSTEKGYSALHLASMHGQALVISELLRHAANLEKSGSPLMKCLFSLIVFIHSIELLNSM